jgi:hypothetical protein
VGAAVAVVAVVLATPFAAAAPGAPSCSKVETAEGDVGSYLRVKTCSAYFAAADRYRPARYRLVSGALPPGLTLWGDGSPAAQVDGVPRKAGVYRFAVAATDALRGRATGTYTVQIHPRLVLPGGALGRATVGASYWRRVSARGGKPPYTFAPFERSGLTLDRSTGVLSGTPARRGKLPASCPFRLTVRDATGATASAEYRLALLDENGVGPAPGGCEGIDDAGLTWVRGLAPRRGPVPALGPRPALVDVVRVAISGRGLRNVTEVSFSGARAVFEVDSDTRITAIQPLGARTGPVKLRTADGRIRSAGIYRVFFGG